MSDQRDFEEPVAAPDATPNEQNTRWMLTACFGILILAGLAFASIGTIGRPVESAFLSDKVLSESQRELQPTIIAPARPRMPPPPGLAPRVMQ